MNLPRHLEDDCPICKKAFGGCPHSRREIREHIELTRVIHEEQAKQEKASRELHRHLWNLHEAATPSWLQAGHVGEPRAVCAAESPSDSILSLDADGMAIFLREEDAAVAVAARNALPGLIVALDQADVDLTELRAQLRDAQAKIAELTRGRS